MAIAERRTVVHASAVKRRDGPIVTRGSAPRGPGVARGAAGVLIALAFVIGLYWAAATYRQALAEALPDLYPVLQAMGLEVEEPVGYSVRVVEGSLQVLRARDEQDQPVVRVRGVLVNRSAERKPVPRIIVTVSSSNARPLSWTFDSVERTLGPEQRMPFETRYLTRMTLRDMQVRVKYEKRP